MTEKKKSTGSGAHPKHTIRSGEVTASIYQRQSNTGYAYLDFSLSRSWKSASTAKEAHGTSFFVENEEDLMEAIRQATEWIRSKIGPSSAAAPPHPQTDVPE
jgi:hypothetical protein